jgi:hypothetical protein
MLNPAEDRWLWCARRGEPRATDEECPYFTTRDRREPDAVRLGHCGASVDR